MTSRCHGLSYQAIGVTDWSLCVGLGIRFRGQELNLNFLFSVTLDYISYCT